MISKYHIAKMVKKGLFNLGKKHETVIRIAKVDRKFKASHPK